MDLQQIWTDGSYRPAHGTMGAGIIIGVKGNPLNPEVLSIPLSRNYQSEHGSDIAELLAAAHGLERLKPGTHTAAHSDCMNMITWVQKGSITTPKKTLDSGVVEAFRRVMQAISPLGSFQISYASADTNRNMGLAHDESRKASTPGKTSKDSNHSRHFRR